MKKITIGLMLFSTAVFALGSVFSNTLVESKDSISVVKAATTTVTKTTNTLVEENGWTVSSGSNINTIATQFSLDSVITISTTGEPNCGTIWGSTTRDWRLYQVKNGNVLVTASTGYSIKSVKFVYTVSNTGALMDSDSNVVASDSEYTLSSPAETITLSVGNTGTSSYGQVRITSFTVKYLPTSEVGESVPVTGIALSQSSATLAQWDSINLTATVSPANTTNDSVTWSTGNASVATVDNGKVLATGVGTTTITARTVDGGFTDTCDITVTEATYDGATEATAITAAQAKAISASLTPGQVTDRRYYIKDTVHSVDFVWGTNSNNYTTLLLGDGSFKVYRLTRSIDGIAIDERHGKRFNAGSTIVVYGCITQYKNSSGAIEYETDANTLRLVSCRYAEKDPIVGSLSSVVDTLVNSGGLMFNYERYTSTVRVCGWLDGESGPTDNGEFLVCDPLNPSVVSKVIQSTTDDSSLLFDPYNVIYGFRRTSGFLTDPLTKDLRIGSNITITYSGRHDYETSSTVNIFGYITSVDLYADKTWALTSITETITKASLSYNYTKNEDGTFTFNKIGIRFGGLIKTSYFDLLEVERYGVMLTIGETPDYISSCYNKAKSAVDFDASLLSGGVINKYTDSNSITKPAVATDDQLPNNLKGGSYYLFNAYVDVPVSNIKTKISAQAYIVVDGQYYFLKERIVNVEDIAREYCFDVEVGAYHGSLVALANL